MTEIHHGTGGSKAPHSEHLVDQRDVIGKVDPSVVLSGKRLRAGAGWVESGRLRLRRRVITETRTVEVVVRPEELNIETRDLAPGAVGEFYRWHCARRAVGVRATPHVAGYGAA